MIAKVGTASIIEARDVKLLGAHIDKGLQDFSRLSQFLLVMILQTRREVSPLAKANLWGPP